MTVRHYYIIHRQPTYPIPFTGEVCATSHAHANVPALASALRRCPYCDGDGAQCELELGHEGKHDFTDALFSFQQHRYKERQGPVCHTRRYPEVVIELNDDDWCW